MNLQTKLNFILRFFGPSFGLILSFFILILPVAHADLSVISADGSVRFLYLANDKVQIHTCKSYTLLKNKKDCVSIAWGELTFEEFKHFIFMTTVLHTNQPLCTLREEICEQLEKLKGELKSKLHDIEQFKKTFGSDREGQLNATLASLEEKIHAHSWSNHYDAILQKLTDSNSVHQFRFPIANHQDSKFEQERMEDDPASESYVLLKTFLSYYDAGLFPLFIKINSEIELQKGTVNQFQWQSAMNPNQLPNQLKEPLAAPIYSVSLQDALKFIDELNFQNSNYSYFLRAFSLTRIPQSGDIYCPIVTVGRTRKQAHFPQIYNEKNALLNINAASRADSKIEAQAVTQYTAQSLSLTAAMNLEESKQPESTHLDGFFLTLGNGERFVQFDQSRDGGDFYPAQIISETPTHYRVHILGNPADQDQLITKIEAQELFDTYPNRESLLQHIQSRTYSDNQRAEIQPIINQIHNQMIRPSGT